jgi:hypothetical protein
MAGVRTRAQAPYLDHPGPSGHVPVCTTRIASCSILEAVLPGPTRHVNLMHQLGAVGGVPATDLGLVQVPIIKVVSSILDKYVLPFAMLAGVTCSRE